jgi:EF-hand domain pair
MASDAGFGMAGADEHSPSSLKVLTWVKHRNSGRARWLVISRDRGLRLFSDSVSTRISPPRCKLHIGPGEIASVSAVLEPSDSGNGLARLIQRATRFARFANDGDLFEPRFTVALRDGTRHVFVIYAKSTRRTASELREECQRCVDAVSEVILAAIESRVRIMAAVDAWEEAVFRTECSFIRTKPAGGSIVLRRCGVTADLAGGEVQVHIGFALASLHVLSWKPRTGDNGPGGSDEPDQDLYDVKLELACVLREGEMLPPTHPALGFPVKAFRPDFEFTVDAKTSRIIGDLRMEKAVYEMMDAQLALVPGLCAVGDDDGDEDPVQHCGPCVYESMFFLGKLDWLLEWALIVGHSELPLVPWEGSGSLRAEVLEWGRHTQDSSIPLHILNRSDSESSNDSDSSDDDFDLREYESMVGQFGFHTTNESLSFDSVRAESDSELVQAVETAAFVTLSRTVAGKVREQSTQERLVLKHSFLFYDLGLDGPDDVAWGRMNALDFALPAVVEKELASRATALGRGLDLDRVLAEKGISPRLLQALAIVVFTTADVDGNGQIDQGEAQELLRTLGFTSNTNVVADSVFKAFDTNSDGVLDFGEFRRLMCELLSGVSKIAGLSPLALAHVRLRSENAVVDQWEEREGEVDGTARTLSAHEDRGDAGVAMHIELDAMDRTISGTPSHDAASAGFLTVITARDTVQILEDEPAMLVLRLRPSKKSTARRGRSSSKDKSRRAKETRLLQISLPDAKQAQRWLRALEAVIKWVDVEPEPDDAAGKPSRAGSDGQPYQEDYGEDEFVEYLMDCGHGEVPLGTLAFAKPGLPQ